MPPACRHGRKPHALGARGREQRLDRRHRGDPARFRWSRAVSGADRERAGGGIVPRAQRRGCGRRAGRRSSSPTTTAMSGPISSRNTGRSSAIRTWASRADAFCCMTAATSPQDDRRIRRRSGALPSRRTGSSAASCRAPTWPCAPARLAGSRTSDVRLGSGTPFMAEDWDMQTRVASLGWRGGYFPGPTVSHHHGRKREDARGLIRYYNMGSGAVYLKLLADPRTRWTYVPHLLRRLLGDMKSHPPARWHSRSTARRCFLPGEPARRDLRDRAPPAIRRQST